MCQAVAFDAMQGLNKNGVLVLASVTGGDKTIEVPADRINLDFVLGTRSWWERSTPIANTSNRACVMWRKHKRSIRDGCRNC